MNRTETKTVTHHHEVRIRMDEDEVIEIIRKHVRSQKDVPDGEIEIELDCGGGGYLRGAFVTITSVTTEEVE